MALESTDIGLALATDVGDVTNLQTQSKQLVGAVNEVKAMAESGGEDVGSIVPTNFVIAPSNAVNKERADLILTGADDLLAIRNAISALNNARASTAVAIRIDFIGGSIDFGNVTFQIDYDNMQIYGNGVKITSGVGAIVVTGQYITIMGFNITCIGSSIYNVGSYCSIIGNACTSESGVGIKSEGSFCKILKNACIQCSDGISNSGYGCTISGNRIEDSINGGVNNSGSLSSITGNVCSGYSCGLFNSGMSCLMTNNRCNGGEMGLYHTADGGVITNNVCTSGLYAIYISPEFIDIKSIVIGNHCSEGSLVVRGGAYIPATAEKVGEVNKGTVIEY